MGLSDMLKRIGDLTLSNINALLDKAENPEKMLNQFLRNLQDEEVKCRGAVAEAMANRNLTKKKYDDAERDVHKWLENAKLAVERNDDSLAKKALAEKKKAENLRDSIKPQLDMLSVDVEKLQDTLSSLESKITEAKNKKEMLLAKVKTAEAKKKINETLAGIGNSNAMRDFERMEEKVDKMMAEADAAEELGNSSRSLEDEFEMLKKDAGRSELDDELAALKASMGNQ
jgi:phage shock protein A